MVNVLDDKCLVVKLHTHIGHYFMLRVDFNLLVEHSLRHHASVKVVKSSYVVYVL